MRSVTQNVCNTNGMKGYFKFLAVRHPKTYGAILARIMPLHNHTSNKMPAYLTEEQVKAELREAGLPEDMIKFMRAVDATTIDFDDEIGNPTTTPTRSTTKGWSEIAYPQASQGASPRASRSRPTISSAPGSSSG